MSATLSDLPEDVRLAIEPHVEETETLLSTIGTEIASKRDEAKAARASSGIEATWKECEEAYLGIDDANRGEFSEARWSKAVAMDAPAQTNRRQDNADHRSTVFLRLTSRYVDAGVAKLTEILLPADDKAFSFSEMPVPELLAAKEDESQVLHSGMGNAPLTRPAQPGEAVQTPPAAVQAMAAVPAMQAVSGAPAAASDAPPIAMPGQPPAPASTPAGPPQVPLTVRDLAIEKIEMARKRAKAAETRIYNWMVETQYRAEVRKVITDAARIGVGVLKAPTPKSKRFMAVRSRERDSVELAIKEQIVPAAAWVDPWNIFPDPACGENIHDGDFVFERDFMSARQLRDLKKLPGYIAAAIDLVLKQGPGKINTTEGTSRTTGVSAEKGRFEVWYFYGTLTRDEMDIIDRAAGKDAKKDAAALDEAHVIVTLINDSVVRAAINPLDTGGFPYHSMPWQRRAGHWAGVGVAEQMRTPQRVTNAALRALLNNAGKSAGSQFVVDMAAIRPADGSWKITPDKIWEKTQEGGGADVRQSFMAIQIPNVTEPLMQIITMGERFAEETTSIPLITQGQSGATTPNTFGAAQLQNNNANQLLRSIGYAFDDFITEPVVRQYYEWLLLDPDVDNDEKGEFQIDAHGSAALVERAIQDQSIAQMGNLVTNPAFGIDPKKWIKLFLKSKRLAPGDVMYSPEDQAKIDAAPPQDPPPVAVAKIQADVAMKQLAASQSSDQQSVASEERIAAAAHALEGGHVQNDAQRVQAEQQRTQVEATIRLHQIQAERDLAIMQYANQKGISVDAAKVQLAKVTMQIQAERELNASANAADAAKARRPQPPQPKPPVQAPGRAADGHAFDQSTGGSGGSP